MNSPLIDEKGFYGDFGGAFVPEMLWPNIEELQECYQRIIAEKDFQADFKILLRDYVGRPTPLFFCEKLSRKYNARIYLKREDLNHTGAHKINNTIGQALMAKRLGKRKIIAETGAGQHGVATATVCALLDLECTVFMGAFDMQRQKPNVARMKMLNAKVIPVISGNKTLKDAVNETLRYWINHPETYYLIGSVVGPHPYPKMVAYFQSVISEEIRKQVFKKEGRTAPDYIIACVGGGSNAAGAFYHFLKDLSVQLIAVEAAGLGTHTDQTAATTVKGSKGVLHGSMTLVMQDKDGQIIEPYSISAGLDYPGIGPMHAHLFQNRRAQFLNVTDKEALQATYELTQLEGIIPALESAHALAALAKLSFKKEEVVVVNLSGRGDKDMESYIKTIDQFSKDEGYR
ncbi:tryptophan synthase subunit beta [Bacteroidetes bacterium endosymbiont of Geopemphigus sp.]|uniref:tryptophan synthase subunit beta n=1 Tax=Bacteroidetes bacterium endosymbiont of Geopemphigus sp. TaxID=2047937 RepID=UPI000CD05B9E|nr:tryptophan synthase subunit beta [Bacteroidetes bacterium endosymbiont of Geopemphigus sp.]